jgi:hypothetical protein
MLRRSSRSPLTSLLRESTGALERLTDPSLSGRRLPKGGSAVGRVLDAEWRDTLHGRGGPYTPARHDVP